MFFFAYEESAEQIIRNMRSIGIDLAPWVHQGLLKFQAVRPSLYGSEMHLLSNFRLIREFNPQVIVVDPITNLAPSASSVEVRSLMVRMIDFFKTQGATTLFTSLLHGRNADDEKADVGISSLMDTWIMLRDLEHNGERNRSIYIVKARGMAHSNQVREFVITDQGIDLVDIYVSQAGMLTGTARLNQEALDKATLLARRQDLDRKKRELERKRITLQAQMESLQAQFENEIDDLERAIAEGEQFEQENKVTRLGLALSRDASSNPVQPANGENNQ